MNILCFVVFWHELAFSNTFPYKDISFDVLWEQYVIKMVSTNGNYSFARENGMNVWLELVCILTQDN